MTAAAPWRWIPTLYFAQGLPYVVVMTLSVLMYKNLGLTCLGSLFQRGMSLKPGARCQWGVSLGSS